MVDEEGEPLVATHACKGKVRYRYYVSRALQHDLDADSASGMRIPAREIEAAVAERVAEAFDDPIALTTMAGLTSGRRSRLQKDWPNRFAQRTTNSSANS